CCGRREETLSIEQNASYDVDVQPMVKDLHAFVIMFLPVCRSNVRRDGRRDADPKCEDDRTNAVSKGCCSQRYGAQLSYHGTTGHPYHDVPQLAQHHRHCQGYVSLEMILINSNGHE